MYGRLALILSWLCLLKQATAVKRHEFKNCEQAGFCRRGRQLAEHIINDGAKTVWNAASVEATESELRFVLERGHMKLAAAVRVLNSGALRLAVEPADGGSRYQIPDGDVVVDETSGAHVFSQTADGAFAIAGLDVSVTVVASPFRLVVSSRTDGELLRLNGQSLLHFENGASFPLREIAETLSDGEELWREPRFNGRIDARPKGPAAFGMDVEFVQSQALFGIPEHASSLALKNTRDYAPETHKVATLSDPYRLFNLDVFEYELDSPMALYGAIPIMLGHNPTARRHRTVGVFWNNPSETWVDVYARRTDDATGQLTHWMSESGSMRVYILVGEDAKRVQGMIRTLTGPPQLPPVFSLGYHQCRWNYRSVADVLEVHDKFDEHELPVDVIWLDIEHTDGKRYFTWDSHKFAEPEKMQQELARRGRKLVTIIDPHLKTDEKWPVYRSLLDENLAVKREDGVTSYEGKCWPGMSVWTDYSNPRARTWWADLFALDKYAGSTESLYVWNDMNEPAVFESTEMTMPRTNVHHGGVEHRDLHNLYGQYQHMATYAGLLARSGGKKRPFVLSRSFYAGSQRWGAIWTGDNMARWDHLAASGPMLLALGLVGMSFVGADVGGFFGNPTTELLVRWYQAGCMQPFFRAHAHIETQRREPWLFGDETTALIRSALRLRYALLPLWYTAFEEAGRTGVPAMRPMFLEFPAAQDLLTVDDQWMVSSALLFKPIVAEGAGSVAVRLPQTTVWYNYFDFEVMDNAAGQVTIASPTLSDMLLFIRGGSIFARRDVARRSSSAMAFDPYTLVVTLDGEGAARGSLYVDDGESFAYRDEESYLLVSFVATTDKDGVLRLDVTSTGNGAALERTQSLAIHKLIVAHSRGHGEFKTDIKLTVSTSFELKIGA